MKLRMITPISRWPLLAAFAFVCAARAQDNYEIQVYGSETQEPGSTMAELHSNFTIEAQERRTVNGVFSSHHALHETVEITHGFTPWFETGFYMFTSVQPGAGFEWVGSHIRPRVRVPEDWHWPVGLSLSMEVGYFRPAWSEDTWDMELRPIVDKQIGKWYFALNPTLGKSFHGMNSARGWEFGPSAKIGYDLTKKISPGVEYYSGLGTLKHIESFKEQEHQIWPVLDLNLSPDSEFNFGVGFGLTRSTDSLAVKLILGRRF